MRELSLFSGAGGGLLGTKLLGWKHCGYVEYNEYCQKVIAQRIKDGFLDEAPIFGDIRVFLDQGYARSYQGMVDVVTAGFPCQPFSVAGNNLGEDDPRNMWPQTIGVIRQVRPSFALLENVPNLLTHEYFGDILRDLAECGYDAKWLCLSAGELGTPHVRTRIWILANRSEIRWNIQDDKTPIITKRQMLSDKFKSRSGWKRKDGGHSMESVGWTFESDIHGSDDAVAFGMDRIEATGNGQVPAVVKAVWELMGPEL